MVVFVGHRRKRTVGLDKRSETDRGCPTMSVWLKMVSRKQSKKKMLHVIPKFWLMYIGIVHFLLFPPLKTFTKHLHNDYSIKINTLLLRWFLNISSNILMILEIFSTVINSQLTVVVGRLIYTDGKYNARSWSQFDSSQDQIWSPLI